MGSANRRMTRVAASAALLFCAACFLLSTARAVQLTNLELVFKKSRHCLGLPVDTLMFWGRSVSTAGDVNGDGYDDVVIAAASYDTLIPLRPWLGLGFIFFGGDPPMDTLPDVILSGTHDGEAGVEVSYAGDLNYDGFADVVMSNHGDPGVLVFFGGNPMDSLYDMVLFNNVSYSYGNSVAYAGDVNGDGYDDIVVGDYMFDGLNGSVVIFFGGPSLDGYPDVSLRGHRREGFGTQVAGGGDLNDNGDDDIVVGEWVNSEFLLDAGKVSVFFGGDPMDTVPGVWMYGEGIEHRLGLLSLDIVRVDDQCDWVVVGNRFYPDGFPATCSGKVYLLFGDTLMDGVPDATMIGKTDSSGLGESNKSAGRVVIGKYDGVLSAAPDEYDYTGGTYLWLSSIPFDPVPDGFALGSYVDETPAWNVASAGDVNGDGRDEIMFSNSPTSDSIKTVWVCRYTGIGVSEETHSSRFTGPTRLVQNDPNPFQSFTVIRFQVSWGDTGSGSLDVFDAAGRHVINLWRGDALEGDTRNSVYTALWDGKTGTGRSVPAGVYFCRLSAGGGAYCRKMVLLR